MKPMDTGKFIQQLRKDKNLTQQSLAEQLNISNKAISRWETGEGYPDVTMLVKLSEVLGVRVDEIINGSKNQKTNNELSNKKIRLKNALMIHRFVMLIVFTLFVVFKNTIYSTSSGLILSSLSLFIVLMQRNFIVAKRNLDNETEEQLFNALRNSIIPYVIYLVITIPHVISTIRHPLGSAPLLPGFPYAMINGVIAYITMFIYFTWIYKKGKFKHMKQFNFVRYSFYGFVLIFTYIYARDISYDSFGYSGFVITPFLFMYIMYTVYDLAFKSKSIKNTLFRFFFISLITYISLFQEVGLITNIIRLTIFILVSLGLLIVSIELFKSNKLDYQFKTGYQSLLLSIYMLVVFFGFIPYFILLFIGYILLDQLITKKNNYVII